MKSLRLASLVSCFVLVVCVCRVAAQDQQWDFWKDCQVQVPGYAYGYESLVQHGYGDPDYYYYYFPT